MNKETKNEKRERSKESKVRNKRNTDGDGYSCDDISRPRAYATRARARRKAEAKSPLRRWQEKLEAEGIQDPVPIVVNYAVELLHATASDRRKWMKIANRGINPFMGVLAEFEDDLKNPNMGRLHNPIAAFQARLNRVLPYPKGGKR